MVVCADYSLESGLVDFLESPGEAVYSSLTRTLAAGLRPRVGRG